MKQEYLYDLTYKGKRIDVTTDPYNWIILYGSARQSDRTFQRKAEHFYYSEIESLIISLHKKLLNLNLKSLECEDLISALNESYEFVEKMAVEISEKMGVQIGCR